MSTKKARISVPLPQTLFEFVSHQASDEGNYSTPVEYIRDLIRRDMARRDELLRSQLVTAAAQIDAGLGVSLDQARKEVDRRIQQRRAEST